MKVDCELFACGLKGHVTYRPDDPAVDDRIEAVPPPVRPGVACGAGRPRRTVAERPTAKAPQVPAGGLLHDIVIMRLLTIDRFIHFRVRGSCP